MITKTITSVAIIIAVAAMFISSSTIANSVLAKSSSTRGTSSADKSTSGTDKSTSSSGTQDTGTSSSGTQDTGTSSSDKTTTSSGEQDYKDFQKCLSSAEGTKGFATKSEIQDCFKPIYPVSSSLTSSSSKIADATNFAK
jgi:hypothetical protein